MVSMVFQDWRRMICHQLLSMWSNRWTDERKLLRCHLEYHCRGKLTKAGGPLQYWPTSDKGHFTKISPSLTTIKHSLSHQLNLRTLSDGQWGLKDQSKINLGPTSKNGNFGSMLLVNQHRNQYQICVKQKCKMKLNVQIITALYCHAWGDMPSKRNMKYVHHFMHTVMYRSL